MGDQPTNILHSKARKCVKYGAERKKLIAVMKRKAEDLESAPASKKLRVEADSPAPRAHTENQWANLTINDERRRSVPASPCLPCDL